MVFFQQDVQEVFFRMHGARLHPISIITYGCEARLVPTMKMRFNLFQPPVTRPRWDKFPTSEKVYEMAQEPVAKGPSSVLMLEDDTEFGNMLRVFLESHSFRVTCVTSGVEGLRQILAREFDVILCDLVMPNLPGDMFYLAVERTKPHLLQRFVFMTGHQADPKWDAFIRKVGGLALWKPFLLADMLSAIQSILKKNRENGN
jgi:CheY-like chemotaxis protein